MYDSKQLKRVLLVLGSLREGYSVANGSLYCTFLEFAVCIYLCEVSKELCCAWYTIDEHINDGI